MSDLTNPIRAYLRRLDRRLLLVEVIRDLTQDFGLTPAQAGRALAESVLEDCDQQSPNPALLPDGEICSICGEGYPSTPKVV